ncbi:MAG: 3-ketoacyl-ACP reductase [Acidobacteria bacterium]|nr:3-ketoacyl-ACP reductase [Acidobacteriota bacterium]
MKQVALITGGTRGIGLGIAQALAELGCDLVLCGTRAAAMVEETIASLGKPGSQVFYVQANIADRSARHQLLQAVRKQCGRIDLLINNAGIGPRTRSDILEATEESFDEVWNTNLRGPYFLTQSVARWMIEQKQAAPDFRGCIVNISSVSAEIASVNRGEYCISKAGVAMATKLWAARLGEFGIPVYEVRPGIIQTDMTSGVAAKYDQLIATGITVQPRWGTPEDVGRAVAALARGDFPYSSGSVFMVDGGMTVQRI